MRRLKIVQIECTGQTFNAWREAYVRAFETEDRQLTIADVEEITAQMYEAVRAQFQAQAELAPRTMTLGFREKLDQLVREQRRELVRAMKEMERDRAFPRKEAVAANVYNVTGPNARRNINSTDA
jgi:predicted transcriptional regulator